MLRNITMRHCECQRWMCDGAKQSHDIGDRFAPPASFAGTRDNGRLLVLRTSVINYIRNFFAMIISSTSRSTAAEVPKGSAS